MRPGALAAGTLPQYNTTSSWQWSILFESPCIWFDEIRSINTDSISHKNKTASHYGVKITPFIVLLQCYHSTQTSDTLLLPFRLENDFKKFSKFYKPGCRLRTAHQQLLSSSLPYSVPTVDRRVGVCRTMCRNAITIRSTVYIEYNRTIQHPIHIYAFKPYQSRDAPTV